MIQAFFNDPLLSGWPFWVLQLTPSATTVEIEKAARDIAAKMQFGMAGSDLFLTPLGEMQRDEYWLREARAKLQNPAERIVAEFWYTDPRDYTPLSAESKHTEKCWLAALEVSLWEC